MFLPDYAVADHVIHQLGARCTCRPCRSEESARSATDARTWVATGQRNLAKARVESCHSEPWVCGHLRMRARHQSRAPDPMPTGRGRTIVLMRMSIASSLMTTATFLRRRKHSAQLSSATGLRCSTRTDTASRSGPQKYPHTRPPSRCPAHPRTNEWNKGCSGWGADPVQSQEVGLELFPVVQLHGLQKQLLHTTQLVSSGLSAARPSVSCSHPCGVVPEVRGDVTDAACRVYTVKQRTREGL